MFFLLGAVMASFVWSAQAQESALDHFEKKIRPVLVSQCYACHSSTAKPPQGGLRLDSASALRQGGNSGPPIRPGDLEHSLLLRAIRHTDKSLKMPPGQPLPNEVVVDFERWIRDGAPMPAGEPVKTTEVRSLWSLAKPQAMPAPAVRNDRWARNEIDRFILNRIEGKGLTPSPEADKRILIRRATFDLLGLPPSAQEVEQFVKDNSVDAYERLIDRLLASPHYGERWGRHWLDVARYADSVNDSVNAGQRYPWSYTYRDWVIGALNRDMPYDQFLVYQLAADRLNDSDPKNLAALGFLSLGREFPKSFPETVDDRIDAVTRTMLGLTVACARCHDHKYDPIPTKDYYSLYSIFSNIRQPEELPVLSKAGDKSLPPVPDGYRQRLDNIRHADQQYRVRRLAEMVAFFKTQTVEYLLAARDAETLSNPQMEELVRDRQLNAHILERWKEYLQKSKASGEPVFLLWHAAAEIPERDFAAKWPAAQLGSPGSKLVAAEASKQAVTSLRDLAAVYAAVLARHDTAEPFSESTAENLRQVFRGANSPVSVPLDDFALIYTEGDSNNTRSIRVRYNSMLALAAYDGAAPRAMAVEDLSNPKPAHVFVRGNASNPGALTPPHFLTCLGGSDEHPFREGSGRLELARAITDRNNPLTARVIVNRVWMHHFGAGLVRTPSDFGFRGDPPTHPELLDYLAVKLVESGWSLKHLHKLMMTSAAYRQTSTAGNEKGRQVDPENLLLWRMNQRRLEIETLRDAMLTAAGRLSDTAGGLPFDLTAQPSVPRRSVYGFIERGRLPAFLSAFDFASPDNHAPMRFVTTVPQQSLFFLNSPFVAEQADYLAKRTENIHEGAARIRQLYQILFSRNPEQGELDAGLKFVSEKQEPPLAAEPPSPWAYGTGEFHLQTGVATFTGFPVFASDRWQGGGALPAPHTGKAMLRASGGEPGDNPNQAVIRRWVSPLSGKLSIEGTLRHGQPAVPYGDGVRGRIVSSRDGELASWSVNGSTAETRLSGITIEKGDTIDFIVDGKKDPENDTFNWAPSLKVGDRSWAAQNDFAGPATPRPAVWARYTHVLLETNELAFVD